MRDLAARATRRGAVLAACAAAAALGARALPAETVERLYAARTYPALQQAVTTASNVLPFAIFDILLMALAASVLLVWGRAGRAAWRRRSWRPLPHALVSTTAIAAVAYAWFLAVWGLNYERPPLDVRLALPAGPAQADEVAALLDRAVRGVNADYTAAHAASFPGAADVPGPLVAALHRVEARQGRPRPTVPGRPKWTLLAVYFRVAGVDGLTAPAALETLLNPDLTGPERPFTLAHEWAHLAGYAPEADANFVAWLATQDAEVTDRYSSWIFLLSETAAQVPAATRERALQGLEAGPRRDLADIAARARTRVDVVQRLGWRAYDGYLRSQGVDAGIRDYSRVVELIARAERPRPSGTVR